MADDPEVITVLKEATGACGGVCGGDWHSDFSFLAKPPAGSVLVAVEVLPFGGDTLWANQELAPAMLLAELRRQIAGRNGIHSGKPYSVAQALPPETQSGRSIKMMRGDPAADREQAHPLIRRHPESGVDALFVTPIYTTRLADRDEAASADLLARLYHHATQPEFCCRWRWRVGDVAIWDNRTTLHYAVNDCDSYRRLLYRTTFGDPPNTG